MATAFMCFFFFVCTITISLATPAVSWKKAAAQHQRSDDDDTAAGKIFPAIFTFGDSALDVGNNNNRFTMFKANYLPYGRDFVNHKPTGRFCNGKLVSDITGNTPP